MSTKENKKRPAGEEPEPSAPGRPAGEEPEPSAPGAVAVPASHDAALRKKGRKSSKHPPPAAFRRTNGGKSSMKRDGAETKSVKASAAGRASLRVSLREKYRSRDKGAPDQPRDKEALEQPHNKEALDKGALEPPDTAQEPPLPSEVQLEGINSAISSADHGIANAPDVEYGVTGGARVGDAGRAPTLPLATPISQQTEPDNIQQAEEYDPESKPGQQEKTKKFRRFGIVVVLLFVIVAVSVSVVLAKTLGGSSTPGGPTSGSAPSPTSRPTTFREACITDQLEQNVGEVFDDSSTPQAEAKEWIIFGDPLQLDCGAENVVQRFVLASLYFSTTNTESIWKYCNADARTEGSGQNCTAQNLDGSSVDGIRWLSEEHECTWYGVSCEEENNTTSISLVSNNLKGSIPVELSALTYLKTIHLNANALIAKIPSELGLLNRLTSLELHGNELTEIPEEIYNASNLQLLNLGWNDLEGTISTRIGELSSLKGFFTNNNGRLKGTIPTEIGNLGELEYTHQHDCGHSGMLPTELGRLGALRELSVSDNSIHGPIPTEIGNLARLELLRIGNLNISGSLPDEVYSLTELRGLQAMGNRLTGSISPNVSKLENLEGLFLHQNLFNGTMPTELATLTNLTALTLYWNEFTGPVPDEVCDLRTNHLLDRLEADCKTTMFEAVNNCSCCTQCCDGSEPGGTCLQCNNGEFCDE